MKITLAVCMTLGVCSIARAQQPGSLASRLSVGAQLFYYSDGRAQPPWIVDSVRSGDPLRPNGDCAALTIRRRPSDPKPERTRLCLSGDTLYRYEASRRAWSPSRPVGPDMILAIVKPNGDQVLYQTGALGEDLVSGSAVPVVTTVVTTTDRKGRARQRVQERYAVSLTAATSGTIESPDPASPGQWVTKHNYILKELRPGSP